MAPEVIVAGDTHRWPETLVFSDVVPLSHTVAEDVCRGIPLQIPGEPMRELRLSFLWQSLSEEMIHDSPFHSDLDPLAAPVWLVDVTPDERLSASLSGSLRSLTHMSDKFHSETSAILNRVAVVEENDVRDILDRLTGPASVGLTLPSFQSYLPRVSEQTVEALLDMCFSPSASEAKEETFAADIKSCSPDGLTWRLAHALSYVCSSSGDPDSLALLWKEIVDRLRHHWDTSRQLPG